MRQSNFPAIILLNLLGFCLFFSWYLPANHGLWFSLDRSIFYSFNHEMVKSHAFAVFVAITNYRGFDVVSFLAMAAYFYSFWRQKDRKGRMWMLALGITMLITAVVLNQLGHLIPVSHRSPSLFFTDAQRAGVLTGIHTKDGSADSFPGDHGMMLMIYACFMGRYFGRKAFIVGLIILGVFALPRVMAGAHWFTDISVGSLSVVLVGMSWCLLTPLTDILITKIYRKLPGSE